MAFFDKLNQVAKNIGDKTGDAIEITKLTAQIAQENDKMAEDIKKIGEYYYNAFLASGEVAPEVLEYCNNAKAHNDIITAAQQEIERIKAENEAPKATAAPQTEGLNCPNCGTANAPGTKFCQNCGTKLEAAPFAPQAERKCPSCGTTAADGVKFCAECGCKIDG